MAAPDPDKRETKDHRPDNSRQGGDGGEKRGGDKSGDGGQGGNDRQGNSEKDG